MSRTHVGGTPSRRTQSVRKPSPSNSLADKIDAIESEMSSEFMPVKSTATQKTTTASAEASAPKKATKKKEPAQQPKPSMSVLDEAAILFANGEMDTVESLLLNAIESQDKNDLTLQVWLMLLDLYQLSDKREAFEKLGEKFAIRFERSAPAWHRQVPCLQDKPAASDAAAPYLSFSDMLNITVVERLKRLHDLAAKSKTLRLNFTRVTAVDPIGCGLLLSAMTRLEESGHHLQIEGIDELAQCIRAIVAVNRRDETEAPWLLLLKLLCLQNLKTEFEETSLDYSITFEVSPPAFIAQKDVSATVGRQDSKDREAEACFMMPAMIHAEDSNTLLAQIAHFAEKHQPAVLDALPLVYIDFTAASSFFSGLATLLGQGRVITLRNANRFIMALCRVMGFQDQLHILPRKM